ncbi:MAG: hypothetical protein LQ346_001667 [Caloplaca aetnensis]|nr:MAG: hypothetical protein LQ346_001667 [Caloplaca aetnensis]
MLPGGSLCTFNLTCLILILHFLNLVPLAAPSPVPQPPTSQNPPTSNHTSNPTSNAVSVFHRRGPFRAHTIANGWHIHYKVINLLYPTIPALLELRTFYHSILADMDYRMLTNDPTSALSELYFGDYTMQFRAERGFGMPLYWEIIESFVEKLLEGTVPITFMAHIAPPGSDVGVSVKMWVGSYRG